MAKTRTRKNKSDEPDMEQGFIPGTEPPSNPKLDQAAKIYYKAMTERKEAGDAEDEAKDNLIDKMKEEGLAYYETKQGLIVTLTETSNLKVKPKSRAKDTESNGDGEE